MRWLLKRWWFWIGLVLLLGLAGSVALVYANPSRITRANFGRIQDGMREEEIIEILGEPESVFARRLIIDSERGITLMTWRSGPDFIDITFVKERARQKKLELATAWETRQWYAKKGAEKIGVK